jgi:hypothetical protein
MNLTGKRLFAGLISLLGTVFLVGCASSSTPARKAAQTPYGKLLQDGSSFIDGLLDRGQLPGFRKGEHGSLSSIPEPVWEKGVTFPVSVVLRGTKEGDDSFYRYTIMKADPEASWKLVEATRWDKNGHVVEQLLPK